MHDSYHHSTGESIETESQTPSRLGPHSLQDHFPKNLRRQVVRGGALMLAVRFAVQLVTWLVMFVVLRLLSPADYGLMVTALLFTGLADIIASGGLNWALVQRKRVTDIDIAATFTLSLFLSVGLYLILWALSAPIAKYLGTPDLVSLIRFITLVLFLVPLKTITKAILSRQVRLGTIAIIEAVAFLVQSGILLLLALRGYGVWSLALSLVCGRVVEASLLWYASGFRLAVKMPSADNVALMRYGLTITATSLTWFLFESADVAVISAVLGQVALGYYAIALLIVKAPREKMSTYIYQIMGVTFCRLQDDPQRMRSWFIRVVVLQLLIVCPVLIGIALVADDAVPLLLGEKWQSAVLPTQLLAPVGVLAIVSSSFTPFFNAIGRADINLKYDCTCAASLTVAFLIVSHFFGLFGICLVWLTLYPLLLILMIQLTSSITTITVADLIRASAPVLMGTFFMGIVVAGIGYFLPEAVPGSLRLAAMIAGGILAYSVWMLAFAREQILANISVFGSELGWRRSAAPEAAFRMRTDPQN